MFRVFGLALILFVALVCNSIGFSSSASAQASRATVAHTVTTSAACKVLEVHLNGKLPAQKTCQSEADLNTSFTAAGVVSPHTSSTNCSNSAALWLFWNANESGQEICFIGSGFVNLTDYWTPCGIISCSTWNDQASSFYTGCSPVNFWSDANTSGNSASVRPYTKGNFPDQGVGNDALSSVELLAACG